MLVRMWRKRNTPPLLVGLQACTTTLEISLVVPQKIGHSTSRGSCNTSPGHISWDVPTGKKDTCSTMFIGALFIITRSWKDPRCPSTEEWIQKMWYIYTMSTTQLLKRMNLLLHFNWWIKISWWKLIISLNKANMNVCLYETVAGTFT